MKKNNNAQTTPSVYLKKLVFLALLFSSLFLSGCFVGKGDIDINIKKKSTPQNEKELSVTLTNVQIVNNQLVLTGTNLNDVTEFNIKDEGVTTVFKIESATNTTLIANALSNITFVTGKALDFILSSANATATFTINFSLCDATIGGKPINCSIIPNNKEVLSYDGTSGKWRPRSVNGLSYQGVWDSNTAMPSATMEGDYYLVSVADGVTYAVGDWIVFNGSVFEQVANANSVVSMFGRAGNVVASEGDYTLDKLGDVTITSPTTNQFLRFNGTNWVNANFTVSESDPTVQSFAKSALPTCGANQVLKSNGSTFSCVTDAGSSAFSATPNRALVTDATGAITASSISDTVLSYLSGVSSNIQTQLDSKVNASSYVDWTGTGVQTINPTRLALPTCGANQVLKSNGSAFSCVADATGAVTSVNSQTGAVSLTTSNVSEGSNLYFTDGRVLSAVLTGYTAGSNAVLAATDTILTALGKLQGQITGSTYWAKSTNDISYTTGNVSIGTATPVTSAKLTIAGSAVSKTNIITSGVTVNLSLSNNHLLKAPGAAGITLQNPSDGGVYTLVISDTTSRTYTFSGCTNSYFSPTNGATSGRSTYSIMAVVDGANTDCYITWITGFN